MAKAKDSQKCAREKSEADHLREKFENATDYHAIAEILADADARVHPNCQHYTSLSRLVVKLRDRRWFLSRADNVRLNDLQENRKFGASGIIPRIWQSSFSAETSESAAMWALYCKESPFAIRISLPYKAVSDWVQRADVFRLRKSPREEGRTEPVIVTQRGFHDILYAATDFQDRKKNRLDSARQNSLSWNCAFARVENVADFVRCEELTGWVKDYEWRGEKEARIVIRTRRSIPQSAGMFLAVDTDIIAHMRFTLSPWLSPQDEKEVERMIGDALRDCGVSTKDKIHRSVLSGALNFEIR